MTNPPLIATFTQLHVDQQATGITMERHNLDAIEARDYLRNLADVVDVPFTVATCLIVDTQTR